MRYKIWITITVNHTFFHSENPGLDLRQTESTELFLKKSNVLFRKQSLGHWVLLKPEATDGAVNRLDLLLKESGRILDFDLIIQSFAFYYFTHWDKISIKGRGWNLHISADGGKSRQCLQIPVGTELADEPKEIAITLHSREVRWEFILIPKYNNTTYPIELKERQGRILFSTPELISFPGEEKVYRCVSSSFISMKEKYNYKISLWEKRENGNRLLSNHIPFPKVASPSITDPQDMITSYFYF